MSKTNFIKYEKERNREKEIVQTITDLQGKIQKLIVENKIKLDSNGKIDSENLKKENPAIFNKINDHWLKILRLDREKKSIFTKVVIDRIDYLPEAFEEEAKQLADKYNCKYSGGTLYLRKNNSEPSDKGGKLIKHPDGSVTIERPPLIKEWNNLCKRFKISHPYGGVANMACSMYYAEQSAILNKMIGRKHRQEKEEAMELYIDSQKENKKLKKSAISEDFTITDEGDFYRFIFNGKPISLKKSEGLEYIIKVLSNKISDTNEYWQLVNLEDNPKENIEKHSKYQDIKYLHNLKKEVELLEQRKNDVSEGAGCRFSEGAESECYDDEINILKEHIIISNNRINFDKGEPSKFVLRIYQRIYKTMETIKESDKDFGEYLKVQITNKKGSGKIIYNGKKFKIIKEK